MSELIRLRDLLRREFFVCHLEQLLVKSMELARSSGDPLVFYALASVLDDVCRRWEDRPVATTEVGALHDALWPHIETVLTVACENGISDGARAATSRLVQAHLRLSTR